MKGMLEIQTFIENRSIVHIVPATSFQFKLAKTKMWILVVIIIGFLTSQIVWIRRNDNRITG
jgi:hypothetical protein